LDFKNLRKIQSTGVCVDTSDAGVGFMTDFPVEPGHVLKIFKGDSPEPFIVNWVMEIKGRYRAGGMYV
jgi:hypothetical protein